METPWFSKFKSGVACVEDAEGLERPLRNETDENVDRVKECVLKNRRITICEVGNTSGTSSG
jgi:hypothetical protein